jgi:nucleotide-binding universal stress UspA family protein
MLARVTIAVDGSKESERALDLGLDIAKQFRAAVTLLTVAPIRVVPAANLAAAPVLHDADVEVHRSLLERARQKAEAAGAKDVESVLLDGFVPEEILGHLEEHPPDLLVMGARGLSATKRFLLGSVSDAVVHHAKCPVLIARG